ncbi:uncharacterized protein LOC119672235 [Teleopsis dalmanni]|uniref:uncharacterized protein LOC119672235 n=1 Tax=Teleopsis dalmanni TaxID=139649 RepID=UPI0018CD5106|nr:uncharacterized protein LOC119672235 [Teleopsis dalmanni]
MFWNIKMFSKIIFFYVIICVYCDWCLSAPTLNDLNDPMIHKNELTLQRSRRQIDLTISADHDDKDDDTEIALEAIANLWRSQDGNTQIEGSAKVIHRSNALQSAPDDWRLGVRVVFS